MAKKKNFKGSFDSLMENSIDDIKQHVNNKLEEEKQDEISEEISLNVEHVEISDEKLNWYRVKLNRLSDELRLWRTGKLTPEKFHTSLAKNNLRYNENTNNLEILE